MNQRAFGRWNRPLEVAGCFASLNMTALLKEWVLSTVYDLQSARHKLQSAIVDATFGAKTDERRAWRTLSSAGH